MREAHRHVVLGALVFEHQLQPWLGRIQWQSVPSPLHCIEDVLYELTAGMSNPLLHPTHRGWCA